MASKAVDLAPLTRRRFLRNSGLLAAGAAAAPLLVACSADAETPTAGTGSSGAAAPAAASSGGGGGAASYTMWALSDTVEVMQYFADKYRSNVNEGFELSITEVPAGLSYRAKIISASAAGQLPDILDSSMNYGSDFAAYNIFEPIGEQLGDVATERSFYEEIWGWCNTENIPSFEGEDHIFGMPYGISVFVPAYRADFFREAGVEFPTNWEELVEVGQALTTDDRWALSIPTSGDLMDEFHPYLMQAGTNYVNDDFTEALLPRESAYAGFQFYSDLVNTHQIAPREAPDRFASDPVQRLAAGQVAMTTLATLSISAMQTTVTDLEFGPDKDWFVGKFWEGPGGPGGYFNGSALHIRRGVENTGPAIDFFKWMVEPEQQIELYQRFNRPPINTDVWTEFADDPAFPIYEEAIAESKRQGGFKGWKLAEFIIDRGVERVVLGGEDVEPVVDQTATDMLQALQNA